MNLVTVIPIARGIGLEYLTYFSSETPGIGSIVKVPLRSTSISAIVAVVEKVSDKKGEIKNLTYGMKKLEGVKSAAFLDPLFMEAMHSVAEYYAASTGSVLSLMIPKILLDSIDVAIHIRKFEPKQSFNKRPEILAFQTEDVARIDAYKSFIREKFARRESVFVCVANREDIQTLSETLSKGIEPHTYILHNGLSKKEIMTTWKNALETDRPILVIATGYFLCLPRADITSVIIEGENSRGFSSLSRPCIDMRTVAEIICKKNKSTLILGDKLLRLETLYRHHENEIGEFSPLKSRLLSDATCTLVDSRGAKGPLGSETKREFHIITDKMSELIEKTVQNGERLFLFCARKGLAPLTLCGDCGEPVTCERCSATMHLMTKKTDGKANEKSSTFFLCRSCGNTQPSDVLCKRCSSWKLVTLGVGIDGAEREMRKKFPELDIYIMDKDHVDNHKQAKALSKKFLDSPSSVMIGTEMALPYLHTNLEHIENTGVLSLDAFFGIPDFRMKEKIMNIIINLRSLATQTCMVQTRRPEEKIFALALSGNISDFYREEIAERKQFGYPPFNTFIKLTLQGSKADVRKKMEHAAGLLKPYELNIFEAFHRGVDRSYILHGVIIIPREKWVDKNLLEKLRMLPQEFAVNVDPENLL